MTYFVVILTVVAAVTDARTGRIPNWLTLPALALALIVHAIGDLESVSSSLLGVLICGLIPWAMYRGTEGQGIGGGDVKLFAAIGASVGPTSGLEIEITAFLVLGAFALIQLAYRGALLRVLRNVGVMLLSPLLPRARRTRLEPEAMTVMRMGPAIFVAALVICLRQTFAASLSWLV